MIFQFDYTFDEIIQIDDRFYYTLWWLFWVPGG